jgi:L-lactate dehydrogenase complex protein LldG
MSTSRDMILASVRAHAPSVAVPLPIVPTFEQSNPSLLEAFRTSFELLGGTFVDCPPDTDPNVRIDELFPAAGVICSTVAEIAGTRRLEDVRDPSELEDVNVAVVRAAFGVAETGSIYLSETELRVNALGYLAQHLVALLDPADILGNLHHAYRHPAFMTARYAVLMSGPSATADIEGVLIRGAQGVRSLTVLPIPRVGRGLP